MKSTSIFKKALIFAVVMVLSLVTVISVIPAFAAGETQGNTGETLKASNISISGEITMLYYFTGIDESAYGDNYYVRITVPKKNDGSTVVDIPVSKLDTDEKQNGNETVKRWIVPVSVAYAQQTTPFTIQFFKNGTAGKLRTKTVKAYADTVLSLAADAIKAEDNENKYIALAEPIKNMLNAGAMAQTYFNYTQYGMANEKLYDEGTNPVNCMLPEHFYDVKGEPTQTGDSTYIKFLGGQALLDSAITLRIFVNCPDAVTSAQVSNGNVTQTVKLRVDDQGRKYVSIRNIAATAFNTRYKVSLTYADDTVSYSYSVLDYAIDALESPSSVVGPEMKNVVRALYLFYAQTTKYVDDSYVPGPKDENGAAADCNHARSYAKDGDLVCPDCGHTDALANTTKLDVAIVGTPNIIANTDSTITLAFSINGTANNLSGVLFTPKCDGVTFTLVEDSIKYDSDKFTVTADNNLLVLENNGEALTGELVTATYTVNAPAGLHKIYIALREAADANGNDIQVAGLVTGIATFEAKATDCGEGNHRFTKYANMSETKHIAICETCGAQVEEEHEFTEVTETENGIRTYKNACVCGNTKAFYVAKVLTTGINDIKLTANTASYSWVADNASSINIVCPELAVDYDLVLTNSNGTSVSMSADAHNGILSMYVLAGEVVDAKLVAQADTIANLDVQVYAGAEGEDLGHNVGVGVSEIDGSCSGTVDADSVTLTHINNASKAYLRFQITYPAANSAGRYMAITYKTTDLTTLPVHYYGVVDTNGTETGYGDTTKVNGRSYALINDGEYHTIIIDTVAVMNAAHKTGYEMTKIRFSVTVDATSSAAFTLKSAERSDDLALLEAKYGPEYGTAENPKPIDSIASITTKLKAGDTDGYYYKWTANKTGFYSFTLPEDVAYDIVVTANGSTVSYAENAHNGYLSTFATAGSDIVVQVISTANGYPAVTATASSTFTDASHGEYLGNSSCIRVSVNANCTSKALGADGIQFTATATTPKINLTFPNGNNSGRYLAITYKASANFKTGSFYYTYLASDGTTTVPMSESTKTQGSSLQFSFVGDGEWHTMYVDVLASMADTQDIADHTGCKILGYRLNCEGVTTNSTIIIKSMELSDDLNFLKTKYSPAYGTSENPKPIDSITNITANLKAGDTDGYYYQYTVTTKGIYTFNTTGTNCKVTVTNTGTNTVFDNNGYVSICADADDVLTINVKAADAALPAVNATITSTFSNGSYGNELADGKGLGVTAGGACTTGSPDSDGVKFTATATNPKIWLNFPEGYNQGRFVAITYKAKGMIKTDTFHYSYTDANGNTVGATESTKVSNKRITFVADEALHTIIIDTYTLIGNRFDGSKATGICLNFSDSANIIAGTSYLTIKAMEIGDDYALLMEKYGTDTTLEMSGVGFSREHMVGLKEVVDTDTGDFYVTNTTTSGNRSYYFTSSHAMPGRYIALTVRATEDTSNIAAIYLAGTKKADGSAGTGVTAGKVGSSYTVTTESADEWVTIVIDIYDYIAEDEYVSTIRVDCCKVYTGTAKVYFKHLGVYETAEAALAAAEGSARVINMGVPTGE